jgi:signal transduction histidine kinase
MKSKKTKDIYKGAKKAAKKGTKKQAAKEAKRPNEPIQQFKSQFIANVAFQIRTMSNAIIGFSDLLRYEELTDSQMEYVNEIYKAGKDVVALVDDVLELFRIESGQLSIDIVNCSLGGLLDKIDSLVRHSAEEKGLEFEILQCTDLPASIRTDPFRLCQGLINLTSNAIKFTEAGYVHLRVSLEDCDCQPYIRFDVADSGSGILFDKQEIIFEPFAQVRDTNEGVATSSGLGLTITRHLAKLLGGEVSVTSMPGEGSVFSLLIPVGVDVESQPLLEQREPLVCLSEGVDVKDQRQCVGNVG